MDKDVIVTVIGRQQHEKDQDTIELVTRGRFRKNGDKFQITYDETEMTGMEGTKTTLEIGGNVVKLMRTGHNNSQMVFEKGQSHLGYYETPYGAFTVGVFSTQMNVNLDENGGEVKIDYALSIDNKFTSVNDFSLRIREA
jgi:uncharacterized beta-barrel protein YwiB (DUF1934 family)